MLHQAVKHKADIVAIDEKETGLRATLNYGHTIGHAVEALVSPSMLHGECVSVGCVWEAHLAVRMGHLKAEAVPRIQACFEKPLGASRVCESSTGGTACRCGRPRASRWRGSWRRWPSTRRLASMAS